MENLPGLRARLERLYAACDDRRIEADPVRFPRMYRRPDDREAVALIASALAYGRQALIARSVQAVLDWLGPRPARALRHLDPAGADRALRGFSHRFNDGRDVACLLTIIGAITGEYGSLNQAFLEGYEPEHADVGPALARFSRRALATDVGPLAPGGRIPERSGVRFFFPSPEGGSACKRMNMFLRWMVRRDRIDPGHWAGIPAAKLVVPLDTHVSRVSREMGMTRRRSADWRAALEVTGFLRLLDPEDPVRYDFALFNLGLQRSRGGALAH